MAVWTDKVTGDIIAAADPNTLADVAGALYDYGVDPTVDEMLDYHDASGGHVLQIATGDLQDAAVTDLKVGTSLSRITVLFDSAVAAAAAVPTEAVYEYTNAGVGTETRLILFIRPPVAPFRVTLSCEAYRDASAQDAYVVLLLTRGDAGETKTGASAALGDAYGVRTATAAGDSDPEWGTYLTQVEVQLQWAGADAGKVAHMRRLFVYVEAA